ncbi:MAG: hypothetical protein HY660_16005 [Armatimonadetes bacterium]|nr:hypothetical protein [Armatimonadota bacterium]
MNEASRLRVLLPHWIAHNLAHADEFRRWADRAGDAGPDILAAAEALAQSSQHLRRALEKLGGDIGANMTAL